MDWAEACRILGVEETVTPEEIRARWVYKANILHPDKTRNLPDRMRAEATQEFKLVKDAYDFLIIPGNNPFSTPPKLEITPKHIRFKDVEIGQKKRTTFEISSIGGPYTNVWIDNETPEWLSVVSIKSTTNEQLPLEVTIEANGIGEPDTKYSCDILVRLENEKTKLKTEEKVRVELWTKSEPAILFADKNAIGIKQIRAGDTKVETFELSNAGRGLLKGSISTSKPWLSVQPNTIDIAPSGKHLYTVTVTTSSLPYGFEDKDSIYLNSNAGTYAIPVDISIVINSIDATPVAQPREEVAQTNQGGFSFGIFSSILLRFVGWSIIPVLLTRSLWNEIIFQLVAGLYICFALGVSIGKAIFPVKKAIINTPIPTPSTSSRDIFAPSTFTGTNFVIGNTLRGVYHRPSCEWAKRISGGNVVKVTIEEARRRGYKRCRVCRP